MRCAAVIAEFNPFHNGHAHLLRQARLGGATHLVAVISGSFVQRGEPALLDKFTRARAAVAGGADLVVELPLPYAVAGAQRFARGAVGVAEGLGCVERLVFGCECGDLATLRETARALGDPRLPAALRAGLQRGQSFARARAEALEALFGPGPAAVVGEPNNALALEYLAALEGLCSAILPVALPRRGAGHDAPLSPAGASGTLPARDSPTRVSPGDATIAGKIASASALRALAREKGAAALAPYVPPGALACYLGAPLVPAEAAEAPILARLRAVRSPAELEGLPEVSEGLHHRLFAASRRARTLEELYALVKTKRYTHARVRRLVLAAYLGLEDAFSRQGPPYVRVLAMGKRGREILSAGAARLPVGASLRRLEALGGAAARFARLEALATDQYSLLCVPRGPCGLDYTAPLGKG